MAILDSIAFPVLAGVTVGAALGWIARSGHLCTLAALERWWYGGDASRLRIWLFALATATAATQAMASAGLIDIGASAYLSPRFGLGAAALGGLMFGFGMALVGACGFTALVQFGGGSLRALIVLATIGLTALAAQRGALAPLRVALTEATTLDLSFAGDQSLGAVTSALAGADLRLATALAVIGFLAWVSLRAADRAEVARTLRFGGVVGLLIAAGWLVTSLAARHGFARGDIESASFVGPVGDVLLNLAVTTGEPPDYAMGLVIGVPLGAAAAAWRRRDVRWEACDDARELARHMLGAALMGLGGVLALGCTIGQGLTAASTLALSAPVVMACIALGARFGLALMLEGSLRHVFRRAQDDAPAE